MRFLLDTHVVVRWFLEPKKLSRAQDRTIADAERRGEMVAIAAATLIEIATLANEGRHRVDARIGDIFSELETNPMFHILPITIPIAIDAGVLSVLRDPADRAIVATARVHRLRLLTSDRRIIDSKLVPVID